MKWAWQAGAKITAYDKALGSDNRYGHKATFAEVKLGNDEVLKSLLPTPIFFMLVLLQRRL